MDIFVEFVIERMDSDKFPVNLCRCDKGFLQGTDSLYAY